MIAEQAVAQRLDPGDVSVKREFLLTDDEATKVLEPLGDALAVASSALALLPHGVDVEIAQMSLRVAMFNVAAAVTLAEREA